MANTIQILLRATDLTAPGFGSATKRMTDLGKAASSMFGIFVGGAALGAVGSLAALANRSIELADATGKAAQKAGMAVEPFSQLSHAAKLADVSQQSLITASKTLSQEMVKQGRGSESVIDQLLAQADVFKGLEDGAAKTARAVALFGKSGQDLIPLLNQGSAAIRAQMTEADRLGLTISADFAKQADEYRDNLDRIKSSFTALGNEIAKEVLPELIKFTESTIKWVKESDAIPKTVSALKSSYITLNEVVGFLKTSYDGWSFAIDAVISGLNTLDSKAKKFAPGGATGGSGGILGPKVSTTVTDEDIAAELGMTDIERLIARRRRGAAIAAESAANFIGPPDFIGPMPAGGGGGSVGAISPEGIDFDKIQTMERWGSVHANTLQKAKEMEAQFAEAKFVGLDLEKARLESDFQEKLHRIEQLQITEDVALELSTAAHEAYHAKLRQMQLQTFAQNISVAGQGFGALASLSAAFGRKQFKLTQGLRIGEAIMHGAAGITRAWADPGWPAAIALTAIIAAQTAAQVATIASQKPPQAHGGLDYVSQNATYELVRGERVLAPNQNAEMMEILRSLRGGGQAPIQLHIDGQVLATWIHDGSRDGRISINPRAIAA